MRNRSHSQDPSRYSRTDGFTLVELLLASSILVIILVALTSYLVTSTRAYRVTENLSDRQQEIEAAVNVLSYDLSLAGYTGVTPSEVERTFSDATVEITKNVDGEGSDRLQIRYFEDANRLFGADDSCGSPCLVTYEVDTDDDGQQFLYRQEADLDERGIVQAVQYFRVLNYLKRDGTRETVEAGTELPDDLAGLNIEISFTNGGLWRFPVGISNPQSF